MTAAEKRALKETIVAEIRQLKAQIEILQEKTRPISPDCSLGRLTRLEAMGESHVNHTVLDAAKLRLTRLNNAYARIASDRFGICIDCEEEIGLERMRIRPESVRCVSCAI